MLLTFVLRVTPSRAQEAIRDGRTHTWVTVDSWAPMGLNVSIKVSFPDLPFDILGVLSSRMELLCYVIIQYLSISGVSDPKNRNYFSVQCRGLSSRIWSEGSLGHTWWCWWLPKGVACSVWETGLYRT